MLKKHIVSAAALMLFTVSVAVGSAQASAATETPAISTGHSEFSTILAASATFPASGTTNAAFTATSAPLSAQIRGTAGSPAAQQPLRGMQVSTGGNYTTHSVSAQEQMMLNFINSDRAANGLPALTHDPELSRIARIKSADMRDGNYFAHQSPTWGYARDMLRTLGYSFRGAGENIAHHATVEKAQAAFLSSPGHRKNIMSPVWEKIGIGIVTDRNGFVLVTQIFAR